MFGTSPTGARSSSRRSRSPRYGRRAPGCGARCRTCARMLKIGKRDDDRRERRVMLLTAPRVSVRALAGSHGRLLFPRASARMGPRPPEFPGRPCLGDRGHGPALPGTYGLRAPGPFRRCHRPGPRRARCRAGCRRARPPPGHGLSLLARDGLRVPETAGAWIAHLGLERGPPGSPIVTGSSVNAMHRHRQGRGARRRWMPDTYAVRAGSRELRARGARGGTGDLGPAPPGTNGCVNRPAAALA